MPERICFATSIEKCILGKEGILDLNVNDVYFNLIDNIKVSTNLLKIDNPESIKKHFILQYNKFIENYNKFVFSEKYYSDRNSESFKDVIDPESSILNLTIYVTKNKLHKPDKIVDFEINEEYCSLEPIVVERIGFLSSLALLKQKIKLVDKPFSSFEF